MVDADVQTRRLERERRARKEAEQLLERKSLDLYAANQELRALADSLAEKEERARSILEAVADGVVILDSDRRIESVNRAGLAIFGHSITELEGREASILFADADLISEDCPFRGLLRSGKDPFGSHQETEGRRCDGSAFPMEVGLVEVRLRERSLSILTVRDITGRRQAQERIHQLAFFDAVTGLPNRVLFQSRFEQAVARARRHGEVLALIFLDLDRFNRINETLGHSAGDQLMRGVAERLRESVRGYDAVVRLGEGSDSPALARVGGDEFTILVTALRTATSAAPVCQRILNALNRPIQVEGHELVVTASIGVSLFPEDGEALDPLLARADSAMHHAKAKGGNRVEYYAPSMGVLAMERLRLEAELRRALERGELELHYQPQVGARSGRLEGLEALVRWRHPERGLVPPAGFLPLAEEVGLMGRIGDWVLSQACRQVRVWRDQGLPPLRVAVNLSSPQFNDPGLTAAVAWALAEQGLEADCLELELTETITMEDPERAVERLKALKEIGVRLSIDDFGTGYSSLSYLRSFPLDTLKIDRSFVRGLPDDAGSRAIVEATLGLARALGLGVVAEGVETAVQLEFLKGRGCDQIQGYFYSPPRPPGEITAMLTRDWPSEPGARERGG